MYYATSGDERFLQRLEYTINELDSCQQANGDGYLAATPNGKRIFKEVSAGKIYSQGFDLNGGWVPLYVMHKVLAGLIDTYQYAHNERALAVAEKLANWMYGTFQHLTEEQMQKVLACEFGGMNEALANDGKAAKYSQNELNAFKSGKYPYYYPNVNWWDEVFREKRIIRYCNFNFSWRRF